MHEPLITLFAFFVLLVNASHGHAAAQTEQLERPNIVLFLVDDLGWQDSSVPMGEQRVAQNEHFRTPALEQLAARGVRFSRAYASAPVCTPTRTAILTGLSPARSGITYWILNEGTDTSAEHPELLPPPWQVDGLQPGAAQTLPELLSSAGYRTIHVGKAHFGARGTPGADPRNLGFHVNIAGHAAGAPASYYGLEHFTVAGREGRAPHSAQSVWDVPGLEKYHGHDIYLTEALALEASAELREAVAAAVPFFLYFAPYAVHTPLLGNKRYEGHYPALDERERAYASMVESVDAALGALQSTLADLGVLERTVILFTSDNGGLSAHARGRASDGAVQHTHNAPLKSGKGSAYEGGTRVPLVIAWPGVTDLPGRAGSLLDVPVISHDLFPTLLSIAGVDAGAGTQIDGVDWTPLLRGASVPSLSSRVLGWHQPHDWGTSGPGIAPFTSLCREQWKLIYFHAGPEFELYDLAQDPGERKNLALVAPNRLWQMALALEQWIQDTGAMLSLDKHSRQEIARPLTAVRTLLALPADATDYTLPATCVAQPSSETRSEAAGWGGRTWLEQHEDICRAARERELCVLLIGDSLTQGWAGAGRSVGGAGADARARWLDPLGGVLNAGISGDCTQHVLWRLEHGLLAAPPPPAIVLMIGTNQLESSTAEDIARGIELALRRIALDAPTSKVLLVSPPPRGLKPSLQTRRAGQQLSEHLALLAQDLQIAYLDPAPLFLDPEGLLRTDRMAPDATHLNPTGYAALAELLRQRLDLLLQH